MTDVISVDCSRGSSKGLIEGGLRGLLRRQNRARVLVGYLAADAPGRLQFTALLAPVDHLAAEVEHPASPPAGNAHSS